MDSSAGDQTRRPADETDAATGEARPALTLRDAQALVDAWMRAQGFSDEVFDGLSLDPRHSRFAEEVINRGSQTVHVELMPGAPPAPDNLPVAGDRWPGGGSDGLAGVSPATFIGEDNSDADRRTGLFAMLNQWSASASV